MPLRIGSLVQFDISKMDKAQLRQWLIQGATLLEPAVITPGNFDKLLFDNLDGLFQRIMDAIASQDGSLIVGSGADVLLGGELPVSALELSQYLASFSTITDEAREILYAHPHLIRRLQRFSRADQEMIVSNPWLLIALQLLLPILFQLLMNQFK